MVPVSVDIMNVAGPPLGNTKSEVPLKAWPVGLPPGTATTRGNGAPVPSNTVATPVTWFETQNGLVEESATPQGFLRFASVWLASPGTSETRLVWTKPAAWAEGTRRSG